MEIGKIIILRDKIRLFKSEIENFGTSLTDCELVNYVVQNKKVREKVCQAIEAVGKAFDELDDDYKELLCLIIPPDDLKAFYDTIASKLDDNMLFFPPPIDQEKFKFYRDIMLYKNMNDDLFYWLPEWCLKDALKYIPQLELNVEDFIHYFQRRDVVSSWKKIVSN